MLWAVTGGRRRLYPSAAFSVGWLERRARSDGLDDRRHEMATTDERTAAAATHNRLLPVCNSAAGSNLEYEIPTQLTFQLVRYQNNDGGGKVRDGMVALRFTSFSSTKGIPKRLINYLYLPKKKQNCVKQKYFLIFNMPNTSYPAHNPIALRSPLHLPPYFSCSSV